MFPLHILPKVDKFYASINCSAVLLPLAAKLNGVGFLLQTSKY